MLIEREREDYLITDGNTVIKLRRNLEFRRMQENMKVVSFTVEYFKIDKVKYEVDRNLHVPISEIANIGIIAVNFVKGYMNGEN